MKIRAFVKTDKDAVITLVKNGLKEFGFEYDNTTSESDLVDINKEYFTNNGTFLIIENEVSQIVATGAIKEVRKNIFKIRKMYVVKTYRKKGLGKKMLTALIEFARQKNATQIFLETSSAMISAINLYRSFGFELSKNNPVSPRCDCTFIKNIVND